MYWHGFEGPGGFEAPVHLLSDGVGNTPHTKHMARTSWIEFTAELLRRTLTTAAVANTIERGGSAQMSRKEDIENMVREVLDGTEHIMVLDRYHLEDNLKSGEVTIECHAHDSKTGKPQTIKGSGVGVVDAFFSGLVEFHSGDFPSLASIGFSKFTITADIGTGKGCRTDSSAEVSLRVMNSEGHEYEFNDSSPSITRSAIRATLKAISFFLNSERAFIIVYKALQHAREDNRPDSVKRYTRQLTTLVEATSYSETIEQIRSRELR